MAASGNSSDRVRFSPGSGRMPIVAAVQIGFPINAKLPPFFTLPLLG